MKMKNKQEKRMGSNRDRQLAQLIIPQKCKKQTVLSSLGCKEAKRRR